MNFKRIFILCISMVLLLSIGTAGIFAGTENNSRGITFYAQADKTSFDQSIEDQKVVISYYASSKISVNGMSIDFTYPEGWSIVSIENSELGKEWTDGDYVLKIGQKDMGRICWQSGDSSNMESELLGTVTFLIPGGTKAGTYTLTAENFELTDRDVNTKVWESGAEIVTEIVITGQSEDPSPSGGGPSDEDQSPSPEKDESSSKDQSSPDQKDEDQKNDPAKGDTAPSGANARSLNGLLAFAAGGIALLMLIILLIVKKKRKD